MSVRKFRVGIAAVLILGIVALFFVVNAFAQSASERLNCPSGALSIFDVEEGVNVECVNAPFATLTPTVGAPTDTPVLPTDTPVPPTETPVPPTSVPPTPDSQTAWHAPTTHEHGDAPPAWADEFSVAEFGHPVIYGGDEATPGENALKHSAFKGFYGILDGDEVYFRIHAQPNPVGRAGGAGKGRYHSHELYVKEGETGEISFAQGWVDFGQHPDDRFLPGQGPNNAALQLAAEGESGRFCETWYDRLGSPAKGLGFSDVNWTPAGLYTFCFDIVDFFFIEDQYATFDQMDEWPSVGMNLAQRSVSFSWETERIPSFMRGATTWTTQFGDFVSEPDDPLCSSQREAFGVTYDILCLPQIVAESFDGIRFPESDILQRNIDCPDCIMPN